VNRHPVIAAVLWLSVYCLLFAVCYLFPSCARVMTNSFHRYYVGLFKLDAV